MRVMTIFGAAFVAGAVVIFTLVSLAGATVRITALPLEWRLGAAAACLAVLASIDVLSARKKRYCLLGTRRQTPQRLMYSHPLMTVAAVWGFDTGLAITTFRIAALTWAALILTLLGFASWWSGLAYGLAFVVPLLILLCKATNGARLQKLLGYRTPVQLASATMLIAVGVVLLTPLVA